MKRWCCNFKTTSSRVWKGGHFQQEFIGGKVAQIALMSEAPSKDDFGVLHCPRCNSALETRKAPFSVGSEYVGSFESYVCPICNFSALTKAGYEMASREAYRMGLVGPPEIGELLIPAREILELSRVTADTNKHRLVLLVSRQKGHEETPTTSREPHMEREPLAEASSFNIRSFAFQEAKPS